MAALTLEIVEGPDAGTTASLTGSIEIGRGPAAGIALSDDQVSRRHARITARGDGALVEDLGSSNGTFVNEQPVHALTALAAGDELLVGVSVLQLRTAAQVAAQPSGVRRVPPALAVAQRRPDFVEPPDQAPAGPVVPELDRLVDVRTRAQARLAPFALLLLVLLVVAVYLGTQSA
jgi:predicted component of type VI protein secretion system